MKYKITYFNYFAMENKAFTFASWYSDFFLSWNPANGIGATYLQKECLIPEWFHLCTYTHMWSVSVSIPISVCIPKVSKGDWCCLWNLHKPRWLWTKTAVWACVHEFGLSLHFKFLTCNRGMIFRFFIIIVFLMSYKVVVSIKFKTSGSQSVCHTLDAQ